MEKKILSECLAGDRVLLKKHELKEASLMFSFIDRDRERLGKFLPWVPFVKTEQDEINWINKTHKSWTEGTLFDFSIIRKSDNQYMGNIGVHNIAWEHDRCELGYWILSDYEGQGYMKEVTRILEKHLFEVGFNRIEIRCSSTNERSATIPKACGYSLEGVLRKECIENGEYRDTLVFAKINIKSEK